MSVSIALSTLPVVYVLRNLLRLLTKDSVPDHMQSARPSFARGVLVNVAVLLCLQAVPLTMDSKPFQSIFEVLGCILYSRTETEAMLTRLLHWLSWLHPFSHLAVIKALSVVLRGKFWRWWCTEGQTALVGLNVNPVMELEAIGCEGAGPRCPASWQGASSAKPPFFDPPMMTTELEFVMKFTLRVSPCATV